jgi:sugar phosphate isomerase/epimerase
MTMLSRRSFLAGSAVSLGCASSVLRAAQAAAPGPLGLPIGLQLYSVRDAVEKDLGGTLRTLAGIGYGEVELAGILPVPAAQLRTMLADCGLRAPSMHASMEDLQAGLSQRLDYAREVGAEYLVCAFPWTADGRYRHAPDGALASGITLDDWRWNADELNRIGEKTREAGIRCAYHNHNIEFRTYGAVSGYQALLERTSPALVSMEVDIAWVVTAGLDPARFLREHAARISMLHVKDVRKDARIVQDKVEAQTTDLGTGRIDWPRVFASVPAGTVRHCFVEQENFTGTPLEAARANFEYLHRLSARTARL